MSDASVSRRGSAVSRPGVSVSKTRSSAPTRCATSAASRSLSPKRISSSATASFSLTTGTTPSAARWRSVPRACRYCVRWTKSSGASSTWPASTPCGSKPSCHIRISRCWPTADTAWSTAGSEGLCLPRSEVRPTRRQWRRTRPRRRYARRPWWGGQLPAQPAHGLTGDRGRADFDDGDHLDPTPGQRHGADRDLDPRRGRPRWPGHGRPRGVATGAPPPPGPLRR